MDMTFTQYCLNLGFTFLNNLPVCLMIFLTIVYSFKYAARRYDRADIAIGGLRVSGRTEDHRRTGTD